jgi:hypothetical protein
MPSSASPQFRFLLRGSSLLIALLALWWWLLLSPMLAGLRLSAELALHLMPGGSIASVTVDPAGWILRVPIPEFVAKQDAVQRTFGRAPGAPPVKVRSFKLAVAETIPTFFTLSFPLFWALLLAAPKSRRFWQVLALGTALLWILALISLLFYTAYSIETNMKLVTGEPAVTLWGAAEYLNVNVVPYLAPLLLALGLHSELRTQILSWDPAPLPAVAVAATVEADKPRRGRYRGR